MWTKRCWLLAMWICDARSQSVVARGLRDGISHNAAMAECVSLGQTLCSVQQLCSAGGTLVDGIDGGGAEDVLVPVADEVDAWMHLADRTDAYPSGRCEPYAGYHPCGTASTTDPPAMPDAPGCGNSYLYCCDLCVGTCIARPVGEPVCSSRFCTSPDAGEGLDCWAGFASYTDRSRVRHDGEPCTCSVGSAHLTGNEFEADLGTIYEYVCCTGDPAPEEERGGEQCADYGNELPAGVLAAIIIVPSVVCFACAMCFSYQRQARARRNATQVPIVGAANPPQAYEVDVVADTTGPTGLFTTNGGATGMDARLEAYMTRQEYANLFSRIDKTTAATTGFRCWHLLLWPPMIAFWVLGGFMMALWGAKHEECASNAAVGQHATPFFAEKRAQGLSYVIIPGKYGSKHSAGSARIVRITLPHFAAGASVDVVNTLVPTVPGSTSGVDGGQGVVVAEAATRPPPPAAPATLAELATLAGIVEGDFGDFGESDFEDLTKELNVSTVARVKLRKQFEATRNKP